MKYIKEIIYFGNNLMALTAEAEEGLDIALDLDLSVLVYDTETGVERLISWKELYKIIQSEDILGCCYTSKSGVRGGNELHVGVYIPQQLELISHIKYLEDIDASDALMDRFSKAVTSFSYYLCDYNPYYNIDNFTPIPSGLSLAFTLAELTALDRFDGAYSLAYVDSGSNSENSYNCHDIGIVEYKDLSKNYLLTVPLVQLITVEPNGVGYLIDAEVHKLYVINSTFGVSVYSIDDFFINAIAKLQLVGDCKRVYSVEA